MEENEEKIVKNPNSRFIILSILGGILVVFGVLTFLTVGFGKIYNGITINGVSVGGLTEVQAVNVLNEHYKKLSDLDVSLYSDEGEINFLGKDINAVFESGKAVKVAFDTGREGNLFKRILLGLKYRFLKYDIKFDVAVDVKKFDKQVGVIAKELGNEVIQPSYVRQGNRLIVNTGTTGVKIDYSDIRQKVIDEFNYLKNANVEIKTVKVKPEKVDIDKIQNAIKKNVQNAEYISDTGVLIDQIIGIEIEDLEEAKKIAESVTEEGMQFSIPLKITLPETTIDSILEELFHDTLSTYSTSFNVNEKERTENVKLAAESINNVILMPGQEFSYNNVVGERSTERGYKIAKVYQAGQVVDGLGGGICQVSSTLYNAVVKADLEVLERKNHSLPVSYVKLGRDATVVYGVLDFRFRNNQQYPVRIESSITGGTLKIDICGVQTKPNRTVDIETETVAVLPFTEKSIEDATLPMGTHKVIQTGKKGYKVKSYRVTKENGVEIDRKLISTDTYSPIAQIKKVALTEVGF